MVFMPEGIWGFLETLRQRLWPPAVLPVGRVAPLPLTTQVAREDGSTILEVNQLSKHFGGLKAIDEVELSVRRNTVHALVGPNGSGKTTLLNVLSGIVGAAPQSPRTGFRKRRRRKRHPKCSSTRVGEFSPKGVH
jgi:branched-chain amino acid transport system permease protein